LKTIGCVCLFVWGNWRVVLNAHMDNISIQLFKDQLLTIKTKNLTDMTTSGDDKIHILAHGHYMFFLNYFTHNICNFIEKMNLNLGMMMMMMNGQSLVLRWMLESVNGRFLKINYDKVFLSARPNNSTTIFKKLYIFPISMFLLFIFMV